MKQTALELHGDIRDLLSRARGLESDNPAALTQLRFHLESAARAILPIVQSDEDYAMREHLAQRRRDDATEADELRYMQGRQETADERSNEPYNPSGFTE
jgi:hypothetical protein